MIELEMVNGMFPKFRIYIFSWWSFYLYLLDNCIMCSFWQNFREVITLSFFITAGRKRKEQHDANQAGVGANPAYGGAYGATPPVSTFTISCCFCLFNLSLFYSSYKFWNEVQLIWAL